MQTLTPDQIQLLDSISLCAVVLRGEMICHANRCFADLAQVNQTGLEGRSIMDFVSRKHRRRISRFLHAPRSLNFATSCPQQKIEFTLHTTGGNELYMELHATEVCFSGGKALLCSLTDITQKTRTARKLKRVLDSIPEVIMAFNADHTQIQSANNATEGLYGIPANEFEQNIFHPIDLVFPDDIARVHAFYRNLITEEFNRIEYRIVHTNGEIRWVRDEGEVIYAEHGLGQIQQIFHFIKDITDRKNDEELLRINEQKYRRIFEYSANPIFVMTPDGQFTDINPAAVALFGYRDREHALQGNIRNHFPGQDDPRALADMIIAAGGITDHPLTVTTLPGEIVDVVITAGCRRNRNSGLPESCQVIMHDMRAVIQQTELETYRRTMGGLSDRLNNIVQAQAMQYGLMLDYIEALGATDNHDRREHLRARLLHTVRNGELSLNDLKLLGEKIRKIYHTPEPPRPVSDGTGGILFDLK